MSKEKKYTSVDRWEGKAFTFTKNLEMLPNPTPGANVVNPMICKDAMIFVHDNLDIADSIARSIYADEPVSPEIVLEIGRMLHQRIIMLEERERHETD